MCVMERRTSWHHRLPKSTAAWNMSEPKGWTRPELCFRCLLVFGQDVSVLEKSDVATVRKQLVGFGCGQPRG